VIAAAATEGHGSVLVPIVFYGFIAAVLFCIIGSIVSAIVNRGGGSGGQQQMMTITDDATGRVVAVYPLDTPIDQVAPAHRPAFAQTHALATEVPAWAARNGATGVQQGVPTFRPGSQHIATPVIHRNTGQQIGTRTYEDQGFGARHYGGSYTNDGTYYYDPENKATVVDWKR
jgi:hypothetical protein